MMPWCLLAASAASAGAACLDTVESSMRKSLADSVRHTFSLLDEDDALTAQWFQRDGVRAGGVALAGMRFGERPFCGPGGAASSEQGIAFYAVEAHAHLPDGLSLRALVLDNLIDGIEGHEGGRHTAFGGLVGYGSSLELGLMRFIQTGDAIGDADGWLVTAASHGARGTVLLGDDSLDGLRLGIDPLPLGPLDLGGSVRYVDDESTAIIEVLVRRIGLTGGDRDWLFADGSAQFETSSRFFRSATAEVYLGGETRPEDLGGSPQAPMRGTLKFGVMASLYAGRRLPANEVLGGMGVVMSVGMVGRYGGLYLDLLGWANDPAVIDNAVDPYNAHRAVASIVVRLDPW